MQKADQQVLDLQGPITPSFDNYIAGPNQVLMGMLKQLASSPEGWHYLSGQPSTGKTHLLLAVMHAAEKNNINVHYLPLSSETLSEALINELQAPDLLLIDDIHAIKSSSVLQEAVFHCLNRMHQQQKAIIISGDVGVGKLNLGLADLKSRLAKCQRHKIIDLDDTYTPELIECYLERYALPADKKVVSYIIKRGPRNTRSLIKLLRVLVENAMRQKRNITVPMVSNNLD